MIFFWQKREKEAEETKVSAEELERREKRRQAEMKTELEKVKKRRIVREKIFAAKVTGIL